MAFRPANVVETGDRGIDIFGNAVEPFHLVEDALRPAFLAGAIVGEQNEERVVPAADFLQEGDQAADLMIGVFEHGGEGFLQPRGKGLFIRRKLFPRTNAGIARGERGVRRDDAHLLLAGKPFFALDIPAGIEAAAIFIEIALRRLMRGVHGAEGRVEKEGALGDQRNDVADHAGRTVDDVFGDVIAVLDAGRYADEMIVMRQLGVELVGLALQETVIAVETLLQRPIGEGAGGGTFAHRREMPFAGGEGRIALVAQNLRERRGAFRDRAAHVGKAGVEIRNAAHADRVMVAAGEQAGAGRRAERGGVEAGEARARGGQRVDVGSRHGRAIAAEMRKAGVVEYDHHDVGGAGAELRPRPPRRRFRDGATDDAVKLLARRMLVGHVAFLPGAVLMDYISASEMRGTRAHWPDSARRNAATPIPD